MKSYLDPHPKSTPHSRPPHHSHHPANTTFSKKLLVHTPANTSAPLSTKHQIFDKHHQSQCSAQPHCAADSVKPINSWLEHCKLGSRQGQATSTPAPASNAPPAGLVEVRPNVWLPSSALQQAQGDFALAVQIAAQGSNTSSDVVSADRGYYNWAADSSSAQFGGKSAQPGLFSDMESLYGSPHASHEQDDSMKQFTTCNMASYSTPRSTTVSPVSATNVNGMFDSAIQQEAMHSAASKHLADNAQQYVFHGTEGNAASAFPFKSPVVGMPFVDPNSFISPQCVLDNNSLFSHQPHSGSEHTPKPDSTGWYAKSAPPFYQPAVGPEQKSALHSSDRISGTAYGKHVPNETWPAYGNYWHSSTAPFSAGQGVDAMPSAHFDQPQMYITSDIAPYSGNTSANVWAGSAVEQAKHSYSHTSRGQPNRISAAHGNVANPQAGKHSGCVLRAL